MYITITPESRAFANTASTSMLSRTKMYAILVGMSMAFTLDVPVGEVDPAETFDTIGKRKLDAVMDELVELTPCDAKAALDYARSFYIWRSNIAMGKLYMSMKAISSSEYITGITEVLTKDDLAELDRGDMKSTHYGVTHLMSDIEDYIKGENV